MFYRYTKANCRIPVDFEGAFSGSCFLAGGAPSLSKEKNLQQLIQPGISLMAMNNTAALFSSGVDFWVGGDKPLCYSNRILMDPSITKFGSISRRDWQVGDQKWRECPNTYFFGTTTDFTLKTFLKPHRDFVWWKNTFYIAIQILYRLGFRKVYLIGCGFKLKEKEEHYSYGKQLTLDEVKWNQGTYNTVVERMKYMKEYFDSLGFSIISCTPDSALNDTYPVMSLDKALDASLRDFPEDYEIEKCVHSSFFKKEKK